MADQHVVSCCLMRGRLLTTDYSGFHHFQGLLSSSCSAFVLFQFPFRFPAQVVPMSGFVESYNVSVAAALILYQARMTRLQKLGWVHASWSWPRPVTLRPCHARCA